MALEIDHEKRKKEILEKTLLLFSTQGYASITFQKIADRCGISRTTLYRYFRNKREILDESILNYFHPLICKQWRIAVSRELPASDRLIKILEEAVDSLFAEKATLSKILEYLLARKNSGEDIDPKIIRHTWKLRLLIHRLLQEGIKKGEFAPLDLRIANNLLYSQLETLTFRLIIRGKASREEIIARLNSILTSFKKK